MKQYKYQINEWDGVRQGSMENVVKRVVEPDLYETNGALETVERQLDNLTEVVSRLISKLSLEDAREVLDLYEIEEV